MKIHKPNLNKLYIHYNSMKTGIAQINKTLTNIQNVKLLIFKRISCFICLSALLFRYKPNYFDVIIKLKQIFLFIFASTLFS